MDRQEFYKSLSEKQKSFLDFLIDEAYCKGFSEAEITSSFLG